MTETNMAKNGLTGRLEKINYILHNSVFLDELHNAQVIFGVDEHTGNAFLVFGRAVLQQIVNDREARPISILQVGLIQATSELEALIATVNAIKGYNDYSGPVTSDLDVKTISSDDTNKRTIAVPLPVKKDEA